MIVTIHQPQYFPWLGYFDKMRMADVFCYLDDVQYKKNEWQNRNRIKTAQGWQWITVPVRYKFPEKINEVTINNNEKWRKKHFQALTTNYSKAPFFKTYIDFFEDVYNREWEFISELNIYIIEGIRNFLKLDQKKTFQSSEHTLSSDPTERLIDICKTVGGDTYLAGQGSVNYMDTSKFEESGIKVITQDYSHPEYPQLYGEFQPHMSIIDLLFNCGPESAERLHGETAGNQGM